MKECDSILTSTKKLLNIDEADTSFDADVMLHINSMLSVLHQAGVGPKGGFLITGKEETWKDFLGENFNEQAMAVTYVQQRVKLIFDPPTSSFVVEAMKENIKELEWRLNITTD